ncbi:MAG: TfoX/Sxy family protein [Pseudomonadota bacterium]
MPVSPDYIDFITELIGAAGYPVTAKRMFGGAGVYFDGVMLALIADDELYLKTDQATRPHFEAEGLQPFVYETRDGRRTVMSYYKVPEDSLDDAQTLRPWIDSAFGAARRTHKPKKRRAQSKTAKKPPTEKS